MKKKIWKIYSLYLRTSREIQHSDPTDTIYQHVVNVYDTMKLKRMRFRNWLRCTLWAFAGNLKEQTVVTRGHVTATCILLYIFTLMRLALFSQWMNEKSVRCVPYSFNTIYIRVCAPTYHVIGCELSDSRRYLFILDWPQYACVLCIIY